MATKTVHVLSHDAHMNLQIITDIANGVPTFEPVNQADRERLRPPNNTALEVVSTAITGSGTSAQEYYYITDNPSNGIYRRYFIKKIDAS